MMIDELTNYISKIKNQFPLQDFVEGPDKGLHILLEVINGDVIVAGKEIWQPKKGEEKYYSDFLSKECLPKEMHIDYIESHKALIGKEGKKIHSASPFALKIKKKSFDEEWTSWLFTQKEINSIRTSVSSLAKRNKTEQADFFNKTKLDEIKKSAFEIGLKEIGLSKLKGETKTLKHNELLTEKIQLISDSVQDLIERYFEKANEICDAQFEKDEDFQSVLKFQQHCVNNFTELLNDISDDIIRLNKNDYIIILLKNVPHVIYEEANSNYIKKYVFNVDYFNKKIGIETFGLSGYINTASDNKPYLRHLTAPFDINLRIPQQKALLLNTFEKYREAKAFKTNPLPVFIDYPELNSEVINVVKSEGTQVNFHKIIHSLFDYKKRDLGNYYLIYLSKKGTKVAVLDLDFVSSFSFSIEVMLQKILPKRESENDVQIQNIFDLYQRVIQPIFNYQLQNNYFIDISERVKKIKNPDHPLKHASLQGLLLKYRKAFYDYVYKSRKQSITTTMFSDIMWQGILDDIRHDENKENKHTKQNDIYNKLNIWFSLWNFFGQDNKSNDLTMANKIVHLQEKLKNLCNSEKDEHLETDEEFAFATGQVIYYLLSQSKAGNKSHALLEPFLQKTNQQELKKAIANTFNAYKHEIYFGKGKFEKLCGELMGYELEESLKELMPIILAGYFSDSIIYQQSEQ